MLRGVNSADPANGAVANKSQGGQKETTEATGSVAGLFNFGSGSSANNNPSESAGTSSGGNMNYQA